MMRSPMVLVASAMMAVMLGLPTPASAARPTFLCTGQMSQTEAVICSDDELAGLDQRLFRAYRRALDASPPDRQEQLRRDQETWVAERDACGFDKACIRQAYLDQIKILDSFGGTTTEDDDPQPPPRPPRPPRPTVTDNDGLEERMVLGHNGSTVEMTRRNHRVEMRYGSVRPGLTARRGDLLFEGSITDSNRLTGTAYTFRHGCQPAGYDVSGQQTHNRITLRGAAPVRDRDSCDVVDYDPNAASATLVFDIAE